MITLRTATPSDAECIEQLARRTWPHTFGRILSPEQIDYMLDWMYAPATLRDQMRHGHRFRIAERPGEPLGYLGMEANYDGESVLKIHKIYVLPTAQGLGIGRKLMEDAELYAKKIGMKSVKLNVNRHNRAVKFYELLGFQIIDTQDIDIGRGYLMEDFVLCKIIPG